MWTRSVGWLVDRDLRMCLHVNRRAGARAVALFRVASKLGDGPLWVALIPVLWAVDGGSWALALAGALATAAAVYQVTKRGTGRARPHDACPEVRRLEPPLDRYSFPSGHTLHAVAASMVVSAAEPVAGLALWPLTALIALSRVVLGLHYPSDVLAGAAIGLAIGVGWSIG